MTMEDVFKGLMQSAMSVVMGLIMLIAHGVVDTVFKGAIYYIPTSLEGAGIPVPMSPIDTAISLADAALMVIGVLLLFLSVFLLGLTLLRMIEIIKEMRNGTSI